MKKLSLLLLLICFCAIQVKAQSYQVQTIPQELKSYAKAVVRLDETTITINSPSDMVYRNKRAITLLNPTAESLANIVIAYDKLRKIKAINLNIYNANGNLIGKLKESDFEDRSYVSDYSLFQDDRLKRYFPSISAYPITIERIVEIKNSQTLAIPSWYPQSEDGISLEKATYEIVKNPDYEIKFESMGLPDPEISAMGKSQSYKWTLGNVKAVKAEPYSVHEDLRLAHLYVSPVKFSYAGVKGEFTDWKSYGKWFL